MKITGTKSYIQIEEENGNVARFDGEACLGEFYAYASPVRWVRHRGETTDGDRIYLAFCVGSLIFASPFLIWMLRICRFRLVAEGCDVTFTPSFGRRDRVPVSAITRVVRSTRKDCVCEGVKKIWIYTDSRRITITREMEGIDDMDAYLLRHVDAEKIITRRR